MTDQFVSRVAHCQNLARLNTESFQNDRKSRYHTDRRDVTFEPGDEVLLSTPLRAPGLCEKFMPRFIGLYTVLQRTSPVNYLVTPTCGVTDRRCRGVETVHVSRLKRFLRRSPSL